MKVTLDLDDNIFAVIEAIASTDKRTAEYVIQQLVCDFAETKINESKVIVDFIGNKAAHKPTAKKRPSMPRSVRARVFDKSNGKCFYCGTEIVKTGNWHVDHVIPVSRGGTDEMSNLEAACVDCNTKKSNAPAGEFIQSTKTAPEADRK